MLPARRTHRGGCAARLSRSRAVLTHARVRPALLVLHGTCQFESMKTVLSFGMLYTCFSCRSCDQSAAPTADPRQPRPSARTPRRRAVRSFRPRRALAEAENGMGVVRLPARPPAGPAAVRDGKACHASHGFEAQTQADPRVVPVQANLRRQRTSRCQSPAPSSASSCASATCRALAPRQTCQSTAPASPTVTTRAAAASGRNKNARCGRLLASSTLSHRTRARMT